jgi:hypothetical protein
LILSDNPGFYRITVLDIFKVPAGDRRSRHFQVQDWEILHGVKGARHCALQAKRGFRKGARHCAFTDKTGIPAGRKALRPYRQIARPELRTKN